jgi:hypothetical protein
MRVAGRMLATQGEPSNLNYVGAGRLTGTGNKANAKMGSHHFWRSYFFFMHFAGFSKNN